MKFPKTNQQACEGSVLIITICFCVILGLLMSSYLSLIKTQHFSVSRARAWNGAMAVAEAGVEEGLAQLNDTNLIKLGLETAQGFNANKWSPPDTTHPSVYWKSNILTDGVRTNGFYEVSIDPTDPSNPVILSKGYVDGPIGGTILTRTVQVKAQPITKSLPGGAMVVTDTVDFKGFGITTDSFQSTNTTLFPGGIYNSANALAHGDVTTTSKATNAMNVGNAKVNGSVHTGPGGVVQVGANGVVGDSAFVSGGNGGKIQTGHSSQDAIISYPDATLPDTGNLVWQFAVPGNYVINGVTYKYSLSDARPWKIANLDGSVYVSKPGVKLWVQNAVNIPNTGEIRIPSGNSLSMYVSAPSCTIGGNGVINDTGVASAFQYYGLPSNTALALSGNAAFVGLIYAPQAVFTLGGGGKDSYDFIGASITKSVKMNGNFNFHFDEASSTYLALFGYSAISWAEL